MLEGEVSSVPPEITLDERKARTRTYVIEEILSTECTYVSRLQAVLDVYIVPLRKSDILGLLDFQLQVSNKILVIVTILIMYISQTQSVRFLGSHLWSPSRLLR